MTDSTSLQKSTEGSSRRFQEEAFLLLTAKGPPPPDLSTSFVSEISTTLDLLNINRMDCYLIKMVYYIAYSFAVDALEMLFFFQHEVPV